MRYINPFIMNKYTKHLNIKILKGIILNKSHIPFLKKNIIYIIHQYSKLKCLIFFNPFRYFR